MLPVVAYMYMYILYLYEMICNVMLARVMELTRQRHDMYKTIPARVMDLTRQMYDMYEFT